MTTPIPEILFRAAVKIAGGGVPELPTATFAANSAYAGELGYVLTTNSLSGAHRFDVAAGMVVPAIISYTILDGTKFAALSAADKAKAVSSWQVHVVEVNGNTIHVKFLDDDRGDGDIDAELHTIGTDDAASVLAAQLVLNAEVLPSTQAILAGKIPFSLVPAAGAGEVNLGAANARLGKVYSGGLDIQTLTGPGGVFKLPTTGGGNAADPVALAVMGVQEEVLSPTGFFSVRGGHGAINNYPLRGGTRGDAIAILNVWWDAFNLQNYITFASPYHDAFVAYFGSGFPSLDTILSAQGPYGVNLAQRGLTITDYGGQTIYNINIGHAYAAHSDEEDNHPIIIVRVIISQELVIGDSQVGLVASLLAKTFNLPASNNGGSVIAEAGGFRSLSAYGNLAVAGTLSHNGVSQPMNMMNANRAPGSADNADMGFSVGSLWRYNNYIYECKSITTGGVADWGRIPPENTGMKLLFNDSSYKGANGASANLISGMRFSDFDLLVWSINNNNARMAAHTFSREDWVSFGIGLGIDDDTTGSDLFYVSDTSFRVYAAPNHSHVIRGVKFWQ